MRGIGAVTYFRLSTDSETQRSEFSGKWSHICEWFLLPNRDEAAQCLRVFYHPEEGTSSLDRLNNFLRLKALAAPGWQEHFTAERMTGTGETRCTISPGESRGFPPVTLFLSDQEWNTAQPQEDRSDSILPVISVDARTQLQPTGERGSPITGRQLQMWLDLSQEARQEAGGWRKWAQEQGISINSARVCLTNTGLTCRGTVRLQQSDERGLPVTDRQIQTWYELSPEARRATGGWVKWAHSQGIAIGSAHRYLTNTGLTHHGAARLQPSGERGLSITDKQLQEWQDLSQEARQKAGGWIKWAQARGIALGNARTFLTNTGLTSFGTDRLQSSGDRGTPITNVQIQTWLNLPLEAKREAGGWKTWARMQGISIRSAGAFLTNTGLTPSGTVRLQPLDKRGSPVTEAQLLVWFNMSPEERNEAGGWATWAQTQGISYRSARKYLAITDTEMPASRMLRALPSATVTSDDQQTSTSAGKEDEITARASILPAGSGEKRPLLRAQEDMSVLTVKRIKEEEDTVTWRTHQINNNLPILQHWRDPTISVLAQAEGRKETLHVTLWGPLFNRLPRDTKARINQDIQWFLQNEGRHESRMDAMMSVSIPVDDNDGYRGRTVYARTDLAAFTVLGPYSGRLLDSEKIRCEYEQEYGREAGNYYFATRSQERVVSAWPQGNILSLINNPVFFRRTAETEARQNVSVVLVGKNINFFLTTRAISAGEELWFDYGPDYQHFEPGEALRSVQVKEEPSSPEKGPALDSV
ncbi:TPA: SET domain-containing protein-lysine N-methyltransferase [Salmonella enterica subsp. enterica serovar Poona]|nr:SET domain-containing protein-lysine N-methyltransferase [Salmonella enterica]EKB5042444.1 SET domain-containing protein-lysine N-methyltransferase [Salmonella enterica]EME1067519.1 SET domain-containing protein-lysine N-methyltransferase [Salmonella enterica]HEC8685154.1 SET domain-containing protein-lysine N-methyltransferase [Salmonella enterica subsp. enterica serovar Oranienburg]HEC9416527.1 SET domain-containing protein-lysine N-methyltransferase [Salmonella enterica subsp. enterica se